MHNLGYANDCATFRRICQWTKFGAPSYSALEVGCWLLDVDPPQCISSIQVNRTVPENPPTSAGSGWRAVALVLASVLVVLAGVFAVLLGFGWRFQRPDGLQAASGSSAASAEKWSPPLGPGESAASRVKRLANDVASLSIGSTNRPDPGKVLTEAKDLADKGQYEEALQRHIWYHNHALEYGPSQAGVRLSFALLSWMDLARKFPKARQALVEIRDREKATFADGKGDTTLFHEVSAINNNLHEEEDTMALFKSIVKQDPELARRCYAVVEDLLVRKGEYELCLSFIPNSEARFKSIRQEKERMAQMSFGNSRVKEAFDGRFVKQTCGLIEILMATGHKPEAEKIRDQALLIMDDPLLTSAVQDAEKKVVK